MKHICPNPKCKTPELIYTHDGIDDQGRTVELWYCWDCCTEHAMPPEDDAPTERITPLTLKDEAAPVGEPVEP